ncbi:MAG TPA: molybdopterin-dependent oxidoreductase [Anaerolineales bacterium]
MTNTISRRDFLKLGGMAAAVVSAGSFLAPQVAKAAREAGLIDPNGDGYIPTMCEMCVWRCGVLAKVKDGKVVKLEGNPEHPHSNGKLCARGQSGLMNTYDPDRVLHPLIRVGKRGEGKFRQASWEEALDITAKKMLDIKDKYGPEAMLFSSTHNISQPVFENILYGFGSPNYGTQRSLCFNAMIVANLMTYGMEEPARDYSQIKYLILTGRNLTEAISTSETSALMEIISQGAKVVTIDPRYTKTASKSAEWLPIKPGTDSAFHLAMINVIISEGLYNKSFLENHTSGFEQLAGAVSSYTPDWAEKITGIAAGTITRIAREFSAAGSQALAHNGWRTSNFLNSFQTQRAITILNALVGNWGVTMHPAAGEGAGGLGSIPQPPYPRVTAPRLDGVPWKYPFVPLKLGIFQEMRDGALKGDPYEAHGWLISRQNPVLDLPDRAKTLELFGKIDFIASIDIIMNDTSWFADVVLPEASYLERYDPLNPVGSRVYLRQPVIEPQGEAKSALWIFKELGNRLGLKDFFQYADEKDYINQQLKPLGMNLEQVAARGFVELPAGEKKSEFDFNTPSGKIEIFSTVLEKGGFKPLPEWEEPPQPKEDEFYLISGKVAQHTQFGTQNNKLLHKYEDSPRIWMNPEAASKRGIKDWDTVEVTSAVGKVLVQVWVTPSIRTDCVYMTPGYGHLSKGLRTAYGVGASESALHVTYTDPVSGSQALTQTLVTVKKV